MARPGAALVGATAAPRTLRPSFTCARIFSSTSARAMASLSLPRAERLAELPDAQVLATAGYDHQVVLWDPVTGKERRRLNGPTGQNKVVGFTPDGKTFLVAGGGSSDLPLMQNRPANQVKAYVCEAYMCAEPTDSPERLTELLSLQP